MNKINKKINIKKFYCTFNIFKIICKVCVLFYLFNFFLIYIIKNEKEIISNKNPSWSIIYDDFHLLVNKYKDLIKTEKKISDNSPIWVMWYQGIEKAPPLIKTCIKSIIKNAEKHPVHILDKNNYYKYISLPSYILKKFKKKKFTITHFSDILRTGLLTIHGGYWIDSTYLITSPLKTINSSLFTLKLSHCNPHYLTKCLWAGNFLATSNNSFIATYSYNALLQYWKKYNTLINYFILDHIIYIAYQNVPEFRKLIANLQYIDCNIFILAKILDIDAYKSLDICTFNKLRKHLKVKIKNKSNKTVYGYTINY